jgi:hypothetical protein
LKESQTFEIPVFQIFCHEANVLLPPGELSLYKGYERVKRRLERVINRIKTRAKATHILTLQEVKKAYDPLAERLGQHPMEFEMKQS